MKYPGIYIIQSKKKSERIYIGSAVNIYTRWRCHLSELSLNKHGNKKLQNHYNKYGKKDLVIKVLLGCDKEDLIDQEQYFIDAYSPWFNICKVAGSQAGIKHSEEAKQKIREACLRNGNRPPSWLGKHHSKETIKKIKESNKGVQAGAKHPMYGKRHPESTLRKMSKAKMGNKSKLGQKISEETRRKMKLAWAKRKLKNAA